MAGGDWDVTVEMKPMTPEQKQHLLHMPNVVDRITNLATQIANTAGAGHKPGRFGVIVQNYPHTKRPRAFALPTDGGGIHLELTQSLLIKAVGSAGSSIGAAARSGHSQNQSEYGMVVSGSGSTTEAQPENMLPTATRTP
jgi:hypothetical protein